MKTPEWVSSPPGWLSWRRSTRYRVLVGTIAVGLLYKFLTFFDSASLEWEDGAIAISYADLDWEPYTAPEQLDEATDAAYIYTPLGDEFYVPLRAPSVPDKDALVPSWQLPPASCLDEMLGDGADCTSGWRFDERNALDFVWTWVNSSDPAWREARAQISAQLLGKHGKVGANGNAAMAHFRDYDELRHSIRSVLTHFRPFVRQFNILASDFAPPGESLSSSLRLGQVPQWLDDSRDPADWWDGDERLAVHHHADFFAPYFETVFNSFAIESQLGNLPGVSDLFVYTNDDMYFLRDLTPADFYTSAFGFVLRLWWHLPVSDTLDPTPGRGEWQALRESNVLLGLRFGPTTRPYRAHMPKIMSGSLLNEMAETFSEAFTRTASRPMRAVWLNGEHGDVHPGFMFAHYVVERWREGLLWSWAVARMGGDDDAWDAAAAWEELGGGKDTLIRVGSVARESLGDALQQLRRAGYDGPGASSYWFSSLDGYPYYNIRLGNGNPPQLETPDVCTILREECFLPGIQTASGAFKHIAFAAPWCGDCIINRLLQKSGRRGLSAFLPSASRRLAASFTGETASTLPRVPRWSQGQFALASVLSHAPSSRTIDVRAWTLRMLHRYRFVLADSPFEFAYLVDAGSATDVVQRLQGSEQAFACLNDDVSNDQDAVAVEAILHEWQEQQWPERASWESM